MPEVVDGHPVAIYQIVPGSKSRFGKHQFSTVALPLKGGFLKLCDAWLDQLPEIILPMQAGHVGVAEFVELFAQW